MRLSAPARDLARRLVPYTTTASVSAPSSRTLSGAVVARSTGERHGGRAREEPLRLPQVDPERWPLASRIYRVLARAATQAGYRVETVPDRERDRR